MCQSVPATWPTLHAATRRVAALSACGAHNALRVALLLTALACTRSGTDDPSPRLVLLYAPCTVNRSFLSPYSSRVGYTPFLEEFARHALVFERHQTEAGQSGTAFASIFSGGQATHHGVYLHPTQLDDRVLLLTEAFARAGWDVHSWLAHPMASASLNYAQGVPRGNVHPQRLQSESLELQGVLDRLAADPSYKTLLVTNFTVTHGPYELRPVKRFCSRYPDECAARTDPSGFVRLAQLYRENHLGLSFDFEGTTRRLGLSEADAARLPEVIDLLYKSNVSRLDSLFGALVARIAERALLDRSVIVFTADHGEVQKGAGARFRWTHGLELVPEVLDVPLLLHAPGVPAGRWPVVTRSIELLPTLAGLAGVPIPDYAGGGQDLSNAIRGREEPPELIAFSHSGLFHELFWMQFGGLGSLAELFPERGARSMWVAARERDRFYELRRVDGGWRTGVYDLAADPGKLRDLYDEEDPEQAGWTERLKHYKAVMEQDFEARPPAAQGRAAEWQIKLLRSLGYVEG
jgi:arylsulfatase A-like enzyme